MERVFVYEVIIGSQTYYTQAINIHIAFTNAINFSNKLDFLDITIKSIMCIAEIDF